MGYLDCGLQWKHRRQLVLMAQELSLCGLRKEITDFNEICQLSRVLLRGSHSSGEGSFQKPILDSSVCSSDIVVGGRWREGGADVQLK